LGVTVGRIGIVFNPGPGGIINILLAGNDVHIQANQQGFYALAKVFQEFADGGPDTGDVHGDPGIDLLDDSEQLVIEYYHEPDGEL